MKGAKELTVLGEILAESILNKILNVFDSVLFDISFQQQITAHQLDY